jgi:hypothetical protein
MIIIWRGWGLVVLPVAFVAFSIGVGVIEGTHIAPGVLSGLVCVVAGALAGLAIWAIAHHIESEPGRVFIEQATGRQVVFKRSAGSLFFIPTRYWAFIVVGLGVLIGIGSALPQ